MGFSSDKVSFLDFWIFLGWFWILGFRLSRWVFIGWQIHGLHRVWLCVLRPLRMLRTQRMLKDLYRVWILEPNIDGVGVQGGLDAKTGGSDCWG